MMQETAQTGNMTYKIDINKIINHIPGDMNEIEKFRSAVCIPLIENADGSFDVLFEVRASFVHDQPKDICLPGGKLENEESPLDGAIRELCEELKIEKEQFKFLGPLDVYHAESMVIYPFAGILSNYKNTFDDAEVEKIFRVPLNFFAETKPEIFKVNSKPEPDEDFPYERIQGGKNYKWRKRVTKQLFYQYEDYCIWGLTAKIMRSFVETILI